MKKQEASMVWTDCGMQIDCRPEELKARTPRERRPEGDAKVTLPSARQALKHASAISATPAGIWMDTNEKQPPKTQLPKEESFDGDSNVTLRSERHSEKQPSEMHSMDPGSEIA
jgi:hypothetical protein